MPPASWSRHDASAGSMATHSATVFTSRSQPNGAHQLGRRHALRELLGIRVEGKDAALEVVVLDAGLRAQFLQAVARIEREVQALDRVVPRARRQAFVEELQPPAPLLRIRAQPEQERRVVAAQPLAGS